jgi:DNA polymerase III sliding clamp (beta) subunit (PCNA family)
VKESTTAITTTPTKFDLPLKQLKMVASMTVFTGKDGVLPMLSAIEVRINQGLLVAVSTDRYCAAKLELTADPEIMSGFFLSPAAVKFIAALKPAKGFNSSVDITIRDGEITFSYLGSSFSEPLMDGKYPAVETLFDGLVAGPIETISLNAEFIGKLAKLIGDDGKKLDKAWLFQFNTGPVAHRANPVVAKNSAYTVLIQPNLLK